MAKAAALREAKLWLRSLRGQEFAEALTRGGLGEKSVTERPADFSHPFFWAGFVLIGDPE
jgi:CHAT domain-containing protein